VNEKLFLSRHLLFFWLNTALQNMHAFFCCSNRRIPANAFSFKWSEWKTLLCCLLQHPGYRQRAKRWRRKDCQSCIASTIEQKAQTTKLPIRQHFSQFGADARPDGCQMVLGFSATTEHFFQQTRFSVATFQQPTFGQCVGRIHRDRKA